MFEQLTQKGTCEMSLPVILNTAEAFTYAADRLREMADAYEVTETIGKIGKDHFDAVDKDGKPIPEELRQKLSAALEKLSDKVPYATLQAQACRDAADRLSKLALDERIRANVDIPR